MMIRRKFIKRIMAFFAAFPLIGLPAGIGATQVASRKVETPRVPSLPTLEWLREREPRITAIEVTYREGRFVPAGQSKWKCFIFKEHSPDPDYSHSIVALEIAGGVWAVQQDTEKGGFPVDKSYKPEWPDWLRKF